MGLGRSALACLLLVVMCWEIKGDVVAGTECYHGVRARWEECGRTAVEGITGPCRQGGTKMILRILGSARVLRGLDSSSGGIRHVLDLISTSHFGGAEKAVPGC